MTSSTEPSSLDGDKSANTVTIRALIDGSDVVKVRGNTLRYEPLNHALPDAWVGDGDQSGNEPNAGLLPVRSTIQHCSS